MKQTALRVHWRSRYWLALWLGLGVFGLGFASVLLFIGFVFLAPFILIVLLLLLKERTMFPPTLHR